MTPSGPFPRRITGLETEYGCLVQPTHGGTPLVHQIRDWIFDQQRYGLIDLHERDWEEPPGNGGFLFNGGRLYIDMGHIEYCTPECASAIDVVRYDRAGDRLLLKAVTALGLQDRAQLFRNNIDHRTGATFGCHENYSMLRQAPLTEENVFSLLAFLTLRVLFTGTGRMGIGGHRAGSKEVHGPDVSGGFQISQRADFIENDFYEWVQHNRAIINTRDEPLADPLTYRRLHLLHGDTNVLPSALYLKVGATRLVLDLLEINALPRVILMDAVRVLRELSHQPAPPWRVRLMDGTEANPVELLSAFRKHAVREFAGRNPETDAVLELWRRAEAGLAGDLGSLVGVIDWITKKHLLDAFRESENLEWTDPWLEAQDLEYHHLDPSRSLGLAMADLNGPWADRLEAPSTLDHPPQDTRAAARSIALAQLKGHPEGYEIDWHHLRLDEQQHVFLTDPFDPVLPAFVPVGTSLLDKSDPEIPPREL